MPVAEEVPTKKVRAVKVGDQSYYVGDEDLEDWWQGVAMDLKYLEEEMLDFSPENDPLQMWSAPGEEAGPPALDENELQMVEAQSRETELTRLLNMNVLKEVVDDSPVSCMLQTRYVYDWRYREGQWRRRARLVCKELKAWNPFGQDTYSPATCPSMLRLLPHMFVSAPGGC